MAAKRKATPRSYLLHGPESLTRRRALRRILAELLDGEDPAYAVQEFDTADNPAADLVLNAARDLGMFAAKRVVILRRGELLKQSRYSRLAAGLARGITSLPDGSCLIVVAATEGDGRRGGAIPADLLAAVKKAGELTYFGPLKPDELARLAVEEAASLGVELPMAVAAALATRCPGGGDQAVQLVRQLADYAGVARITLEHLEVFAAPPGDDNIFHMLDAALSGNGGKAVEIAREMMRGGDAPQRIQVMLARSVKQIAQAKLLADCGVARHATAESLPEGVRALLPRTQMVLETASADWQRDRLWKQASRFSWRHLRQAVDHLVLTEAGAKGWESGIADPEAAFEWLLASLAAIPSQSGGR